MFEEQHGFMGITVTDDVMTFRHITYVETNNVTDYSIVYSYSRIKEL